MSALSLAGQGVLTFPSTVVLPDWIPSNTAQQAPANTDSPILAAVAPPPLPHPLDAPTDPETQILTLTVTETLTITVPAAIASPSPPSTAAKPPKTKWRSPKRMRDLGAFNISAFSGGRDNLEIVQGIPSSIASFAVSNASFAASAPSPLDDESDADATQIHPRATPWPPNASSLQLLYPAGSINPARRPIGGAQFYAAPLDLTRARNVSLGYSAFFPADFDWVRGGKMPGLYGGRAGCSGGSAALDCWSTRLMWRSEGRGELYLYAPKAKQPPSLCSAPRSVCSATYGLSIGRGAFAWAPGRWTRVLQTVTLNTPGAPDGCFALDVDGVRVIERCDVFYRDAPPPPAGGGGGGGIGGLLGTLLSDLLRRGAASTQSESASSSTLTSASTLTAATTETTATTVGEDAAAAAHPLRMYDAQQGWAVHSTPGPGSASATTSSDLQPTAPPSPASASVAENDDGDDDGGANEAETHDHDASESVVGFKGLFFSSFFGGHTARYATPTDQYVWFKDFYMSYNS